MTWMDEYEATVAEAAARRLHPAGHERDVLDSAAGNPDATVPDSSQVTASDPTAPEDGCAPTRSDATGKPDTWRVGVIDGAVRGALSGFLKRIGGDR